MIFCRSSQSPDLTLTLDQLWHHETNIKKIQVIQNSAVRFILKLKYNTPSNIIHQDTLNKLTLLAVSNRLFELSERYVRAGLSHSVPLVVRLMEEYKEEYI
ncbi:hypothetical protein BpHYR1_002922 [Brachionus plicatilis]|uniref:Uncharacterized protein n=1 Tax=Brachionus plicatilis TaxID=10195 RepID=A0A3M7PA19_BRAPC|nr:hypothetical protein BpHYR1_002922 [Brachionus plicatilis]